MCVESGCEYTVYMHEKEAEVQLAVTVMCIPDYLITWYYVTQSLLFWGLTFPGARSSDTSGCPMGIHRCSH